jgi:hypothetical protein
METVKGFFDSFKEFIWDIIGYLLPGCFVLILFYGTVNDKYLFQPDLKIMEDKYFFFVLIILAYLIGYVVYGLGCIKERLFGKFSYTKKIERNISERQAFQYSKEILSKELEKKQLNDKLSTGSVRDIRNLVMSFIPESDQKIYTFTFRSDLANHTGNISLVFGFLGLVFSSFPGLKSLYFKNDSGHIILYVILILSYFLLRETRNRFYHVSIGLPFSIYTSNSLKK